MPKRQQTASLVKKGRNVRQDQSFARSVIEEIFGPLTKDNVDLWVERTFLTILAKVYESLVLRKRISPKEMVELTKAFTENCKLDRAAYGARFTTPRGKNLLNGFEEAIRRLYGLNRQPAHSKPTRAPRGSRNGADQTSSQGRAESDAQFRVDEQQQDHDDQPPR